MVYLVSIIDMKLLSIIYIVHNRVFHFSLYGNSPFTILRTRNNEFQFLGFLSFILLFLTLMSGIVCFVLKYSIKFLSRRTNLGFFLKWSPLPHHLLGSLGYGIGIGSLCCGFTYSKNFMRAVPYLFRITVIILALIVATWTMLCSFLAIYIIIGKIMKLDSSPRNEPSIGNNFMIDIETQT